MWDTRIDLLNKVKIYVRDQTELHFILTDRPIDLECKEFESCYFLHHVARTVANMLNKHVLSDYSWLEDANINSDEWIHLCNVAGQANEELKQLKSRQNL